MGTASFLFVNENLQSKHKGRRPTPSIQRHVQRYHAEKSRRQKNASLKVNVQKTQELLGWLERDRSDSLSLVAEQDKCQQLCCRSKTHDSNNTTDGESPLGSHRPNSPLLPNWNDPIGAKHRSSLSRQHFSTFAFTEVAYDEVVHRSIQYFTSRWKPFACKCDVNTPLCVWPGDVDSAHCPEHILNVNDIVRNCLHNKMHMYCLIATCAGRIRSVEMDIVQHIDGPEKYMAKAINLLRNFLKDCPVIDEQIIIDVYFLSTFEYYLKNYSLAQIYLRIIKSMVETIGGFQRLGEYARRLLWNGDVSVALEYPSQPILPPIWTLQPIGTSSEERIGLDGAWVLADRMGSSFLHHHDFLSPGLLAIAADICYYAKLLKPSATVELTRDTQTIFERGTALLHRLLSFGPDAEAKLDHNSLKENCCRYALTLWVWNVFIRGAANTAVTGHGVSTDVTNARQMRPIIAKQLKQAIFRACEYVNECRADLNEYRLRLWIIGVGISGAAQGKTKDWYCDFFVQLANVLKVRTIEQVSHIFGGYAYLEGYEANNMEQLAELLNRPTSDLPTGVIRAHR
jgi:hypothetical protein